MREWKLNQKNRKRNLMRRATATIRHSIPQTSLQAPMRDRVLTTGEDYDDYFGVGGRSMQAHNESIEVVSSTSPRLCPTPGQTLVPSLRTPAICEVPERILSHVKSFIQSLSERTQQEGYRLNAHTTYRVERQHPYRLFSTYMAGCYMYQLHRPLEANRLFVKAAANIGGFKGLEHPNTLVYLFTFVKRLYDYTPAEVVSITLRYFFRTVEMALSPSHPLARMCQQLSILDQPQARATLAVAWRYSLHCSHPPGRALKGHSLIPRLSYLYEIEAEQRPIQVEKESRALISQNYLDENTSLDSMIYLVWFLYMHKRDDEAMLLAKEILSRAIRGTP